jgi:hypothetical protein
MQELTTEQKVWRMFHLQICYYSFNLLEVLTWPLIVLPLLGIGLTVPLMLWYWIEGIISIFTITTIIEDEDSSVSDTNTSTSQTA